MLEALLCPSNFTASAITRFSIGILPSRGQTVRKQTFKISTQKVRLRQHNNTATAHSYAQPIKRGDDLLTDGAWFTWRER